MNAIEVKGVAKRYGEFALEDVSFVLPEGCVLGLVGENGAGKSTLIRMMMGACCPDSGSIRVLGEEARRNAAFKKVKQDIGVVLDEACLPQELTAQQVGKVFAGVYANWNQQQFEALSARFELPKEKKVKEYSRGMKMKLAIAAAMCHEAKLLILDEATGGLDPVVRDEILDLFNDYTRNANNSILMSSHIVSDLEKICDYIVFLHKGRVMLADEKDALFEKYALVLYPEQADIPEKGVVAVLRTNGVQRVLMERDSLSKGEAAEHMTLEDILLILTKGERR